VATGTGVYYIIYYIFII